MFTYINENFLHAPSADLSRDTVKTLIQLMLAQGQEVFLEKQVTDGKKVGLLAKLASQASFLYGQALEGVQENVTKAVFERVWLLVTQVSFWIAYMYKPYSVLLDQKQSYERSSTILSSTSRQRCEFSRGGYMPPPSRREPC